MGEPNILFIDIETAPNLGWFWGMWEQNFSYIQVKREGYLLMCGYQWLEDKKPSLISIHTQPKFRNDIHTEKHIMKQIWDLLDKAHLVIAHNGDRFDKKWINYCFMKHGYFPPSDYRTVDTCTASRGQFKMNTHKLDDIAQRFKLGKKIDTGGFPLWIGCMEGIISFFKKMGGYCKHDVTLCKEWYHLMLPWFKNHPNLSAIAGNNDCPRCQSDKYHSDGKRYTQAGWKQRYECNNCHHRFTVGFLHRTTDTK